MSSIFAELLTVANKLNNWEEDPVGGAKVLWTSTTVYQVTVPAGKRWFLFGGATKRNVSSTVSGAIFDSAGEIILFIMDHAAAAGIVHYPELDNVGASIFPWVMDAGEYIKLTFGTAQDAGSYASCMVLEIDV